MSRYALVIGASLLLFLGGAIGLLVTGPKETDPSAASYTGGRSGLRSSRSDASQGGSASRQFRPVVGRAGGREGEGSYSEAGREGARAPRDGGFGPRSAGSGSSGTGRSSTGRRVDDGNFVVAGGSGRSARERKRALSASASRREGELAEDDSDAADEDEPPVGIGLRGEYWKFIDERLGSLRAPSFPPTISRVDPAIDFRDPASFQLPFRVRNLAVRWSGFLYAEDDGVYTFNLGSDDGSRLTIDAAPVILMNRLQPHREASAEVVLSVGFHPIEVLFFQNEGPGSCVLQWVPPFGGPEVVPPDVLFPSDAVPPQAAPRILDVTPPRARRGQVITITGEGFPEPGEPFEVLFSGREVSARTGEEGEILATVPPGIASGEIFVRLRETTSEGFPYEVGDVFGLLGSYSFFSEQIRTFDDVAAGPIQFQRVEPQIDIRNRSQFRLPQPPVRFAATWTGSLYEAEGGERRIALVSDDGSRLFIDGAEVISNDGLHGMRRREATAFLTEGFHGIQIDFFQNEGGAGVQLLWDVGDGLVVVPLGALYPPPDFELLAPPRIDAVEPEAAAQGELVTIRGEGFGFDPGAVRVTFRGVVATPEAASDDRIEVRVPAGGRTGDLIVQAGSLASGSVPFTVLGRGLTAAYFRFDEQLARMPDLHALAPDHVRIEPNLRFGEQFSFELPFPAEKFAGLFTGTLEAPQDGEYLFSLFSDDGAQLLIDGAMVVDHDGLHGFSRRDGRIALTRGPHAFEVAFFQNLGAAALDLHWTLPNGRRQRVPEGVFFPE